MGSFGNMRPRLSNKVTKTEEPAAPAKAEKKPAAKDKKK